MGRKPVLIKMHNSKRLLKTIYTFLTDTLAPWDIANTMQQNSGIVFYGGIMYTQCFGFLD